MTDAPGERGPAELLTALADLGEICDDLQDVARTLIDLLPNGEPGADDRAFAQARLAAIGRRRAVLLP